MTKRTISTLLMVLFIIYSTNLPIHGNSLKGEELLKKGMGYYDNAFYEKAIYTLKYALNFNLKESKIIEANFGIALSYIILGKKENSKTFIKEINKINPDYQIDKTQYPPDVVDFFNEVKNGRKASNVIVKSISSRQKKSNHKLKPSTEIPSTKSVDWYIEKGDYFFDSGRYSIAKKYYRKILITEPLDPIAKDKIKSCDKYIYVSKEEKKFYKYFNKGDKYYKEGKIEYALKYYLTACQLLPSKNKIIAEKFKEIKETNKAEWKSFKDKNTFLRRISVRQAKRVKYVSPIYPKIAMNNRINGSVVLKVRTDVFGKFMGFRIISGHPLLNGAAINAVKQWEYEPYLVCGIPNPTIFTVTVNFNKH